MILVLLGTQDKPFTRLLKELDKLIEEKIITDKVIVQAGLTKYESKNMEIFDLKPVDELMKLQSMADIIITHGGVGSILSAVKMKKKVIAVPRLQEYGEHTNNHQIQIVNEFFKTGYILKADNPCDLKEIMKNLGAFKLKEYKSNNKNFVKLIEDFIDNL